MKLPEAVARVLALAQSNHDRTPGDDEAISLVETFLVSIEPESEAE